MQHPPLIVISGAIGSGKGTIIHALMDEMSLEWVPTHTTRPMRKDDTVLSNRIFDTETTFDRYKERKELIESTEIGGYQYGLLRADLEKALHQKKPCIVELSVSGGVAVAKEYKDALLIFVTAPEGDRKTRVAHRHLPDDEAKERFAISKQEEKIARDSYDYIVENPEDQPELAIDTIKDHIEETFPNLTA